MFLDLDVNIVNLINGYSSMFQKYINEKYPIKHKNSITDSNLECNESKNGILRGLVHKIGFTGFDGKLRDEYLMDIINSGYLEIQFKENNPASGIFTTILGKDNDIKKLYRGNDSGIFFMISLSALEDFDYWAGPHGLGARKKTHFYKGICYKCNDELEKYSAAERTYMAIAGDKHEEFYELMFASDLNIKRYVEEICVPNKDVYDELMESEKILPWVKELITNKEDKKKVYRKNCSGKEPEKIKETVFKKMVKNVVKREMMENIPRVDYNAINTKRKANIIYDTTTSSSGGMRFPTPK
jgi:predicted DNA-binding protein YlxM (UPF0122 family)